MWHLTKATIIHSSWRPKAEPHWSTKLSVFRLKIAIVAKIVQMERYNFRPILELKNIIASSSLYYRVLKWEGCFEWELLETSKKLEDLCCHGRIHSFLFHFWFGQWKASLHLSAMFLAAMECQASGCGLWKR